MEKLNMKPFAEQLKTLRKNRFLTQSRLAELINVSTQVVYRWEVGAVTPHFDKLLQLADVFQVSLDELVGRTELKNKQTFRNPKLQTFVEKIDELSDTDQETLINVIDSLLKRNQMTKLLSA